VAETVHTGKCHCGAVTFRATGLADVWYCHCRQCRSLTGHYMAACRTSRDALTLSGDVAWTQVSEHSSHGFCPQCHSPLFWSNDTRPTISVVLGSLDDDSGLAAAGHIFVSEKGHYYEITDGLPQYETWPGDGPGSLASLSPALSAGEPA